MNKQTNKKTIYLEETQSHRVQEEKNQINMLAVFAKPLNKNKEEIKKNNNLKSKLYSPLNLNSILKGTGRTDVDRIGGSKSNNNKNSLFLSVLNLNLQGIKIYDQLLTKVVSKPSFLKTRFLNSKNSSNSILTIDSNQPLSTLNPNRFDSPIPSPTLKCTDTLPIKSSLINEGPKNGSEGMEVMNRLNENINKNLINSAIEIPNREISSINTTTKIFSFGLESFGPLVSPDFKEGNEGFEKVNFSKESGVDTTHPNNKIENFVYDLKKEYSDRLNKEINLKNPSIQTDQKVNLLFSNKRSEASLINAKKEKERIEGLKNYMKIISEFNSKIATTQYNGNNSFNFNVANNKSIKKIESLLVSFFISLSILISKPIFEFTPEKVTLRLFYYFLSNKKGRSFLNFIRPSELKGKNKNKKVNNKKESWHLLFNQTWTEERRNKLQILVKILNYFFKKPVELELVRLYTPFSDSKLLVQLLSLIMNKIKFNKIKKRVLKGTFSKTPNKWFTKKIFSLDPSYLSGVKIKIAGRLLTHRVIPRKTIKIIHKGILARSKVISNDTARFTNKNKRGAYSITVSITNIMKNN